MRLQIILKKLQKLHPKQIDLSLGRCKELCKKLHEWGNIFFDIAKRGLVERKQLNSKGNDETVYLKHVENVIKNKKNRAQLLLDQYNKTNNLDFFKNEKENFNYSGF